MVFFAVHFSLGYRALGPGCVALARIVLLAKQLFTRRATALARASRTQSAVAHFCCLAVPAALASWHGDPVNSQPTVLLSLLAVQQAFPSGHGHFVTALLPTAQLTAHTPPLIIIVGSLWPCSPLRPPRVSLRPPGLLDPPLCPPVPLVSLSIPPRVLRCLWCPRPLCPPCLYSLSQL